MVRGWTAKADADLATATLVLDAGPDGPLDIAAFHAQQCAEKYLKALLCSRVTDVPRIHDIGVLLSRTGLGKAVGLTSEEVRLLTDYATVTLHPGDYEPVTLQEARSAVRWANESGRW